MSLQEELPVAVASFSSFLFLGGNSFFFLCAHHSSFSGERGTWKKEAKKKNQQRNEHSLALWTMEKSKFQLQK
jgi:hypothetical protein